MLADKQGRMPLHESALRGHIDASELLIEYGAEPNVVDERLRTPLHEAASGGHEGVAQLLIASGADPNAVDIWGNKPLKMF